MALVFIVILLALLQYLVFGELVGRARVTYGVRAPATTGDPTFERINRVQQNTLENLVAFVPAIWIFGLYVDPFWAAGVPPIRDGRSTLIRLLKSDIDQATFQNRDR